MPFSSFIKVWIFVRKCELIFNKEAIFSQILNSFAHFVLNSAKSSLFHTLVDLYSSRFKELMAMQAVISDFFSTETVYNNGQCTSVALAQVIKNNWYEGDIEN